MTHTSRLFSIAAIAFIFATGGLVFADAQTYTVPLTAAPGVAYNPSGTATFVVSGDGSSIAYTVNVNDLHDPTIAVLKDTTADSAHSDIVAYLAPSQLPPNSTYQIGQSTQEFYVPTYDYSDPNKDFSLSGNFGGGTITAENLMGPLAGKTMTDLINDIKAGRVYVSVRSADYSMDALSGALK